MDDEIKLPKEGLHTPEEISRDDEEKNNEMQKDENTSHDYQHIDAEKQPVAKENRQVYEPKSQALVEYKRLSGWVNFMGVFSVVLGLVLCLGIVTAIIGVPLIIAGRRLTGAVDSLKAFTRTNDFNKLSDAIDNINKYFRVYGILTLVGLLIGFFSLIALIAYGILSGNIVFYGCII